MIGLNKTKQKTKTLSSQFLLWNKITGIFGFPKSHKTKILNILKYIAISKSCKIFNQVLINKVGLELSVHIVIKMPF